MRRHFTSCSWTHHRPFCALLEKEISKLHGARLAGPALGSSGSNPYVTEMLLIPGQVTVWPVLNTHRMKTTGVCLCKKMHLVSRGTGWGWQLVEGGAATCQSVFWKDVLLIIMTITWIGPKRRFPHDFSPCLWVKCIIHAGDCHVWIKCDRRPSSPLSTCWYCLKKTSFMTQFSDWSFKVSFSRGMLKTNVCTSTK